MRCIFCKQDSSDSQSIEHIMPESIGSKKRILKAGIVCDQCNNYFARKVEEPILNHPSMRNLRAWYQVPNKRGKYPSLKGYIGGQDIDVGIRLDQDGKILIEPEQVRFSQDVKSVIEEGFKKPLIFKIEMDPPKRAMSRFLCEIALETSAETFSKDPCNTDTIIDHEFYDNIRTYARYGSNIEEWSYSQRRIFPEETLMKHPETNEWVQAGFGCCWFMSKYKETLFAFCFYVIEFVINVGGPSISGYNEWLEEHGHISPFVERLGCHLETKIENGKKKYYLHGNFDTRKGFEFDMKNGYFY